MHENHYPRLAAMLVLSFIAMYALMYSMVDRLSNVYMSLNQVYMAALMAAPMAVIEIAVMSGMYKDRRANAIVVAGATVVFALAWFGIRQQAAIGDTQFLRSMIPHHSGAILMCKEAPIADAEIRKLCGTIIESQQREIDEMKALLARNE
jgi:uncharacterized protein (DUF305 family)